MFFHILPCFGVEHHQILSIREKLTVEFHILPAFDGKDASTLQLRKLLADRCTEFLRIHKLCTMYLLSIHIVQGLVGNPEKNLLARVLLVKRHADDFVKPLRQVFFGLPEEYFWLGYDIIHPIQAEVENLAGIVRATYHIPSLVVFPEQIRMHNH